MEKSASDRWRVYCERWATTSRRTAARFDAREPGRRGIARAARNAIAP